MKSLIAAFALLTLPLTAHAADDKHPPQKAMDSATPEMKNPGDKSKEHAPQKAMDSAVPAGSGGSGSASDGASPGSGGSTYNANEANKAAGKTDDKQKLPPENSSTQGKQ